MTYRDYRFGFSGTDLISPTQFEYYPELKYRMPQALHHAFYRLEEVEGEINDRAREATRAREKSQYEEESARFKKFQQGSMQEHLAAPPLSAEAISQAREQSGITGR